MRYDIPIYFQTVVPGGYDKTTGDYEDEAIEETEMLANVTDTDTETLQLVYGDIRQGSLTIRVLGHHTEPFSRIRVQDKAYRVDYKRDLRHRQTFVVSEVQS